MLIDFIHQVKPLSFQQQVGTFQEIIEFLVNSGKEEKQRYQTIVRNLFRFSEVIPLTAEILTSAMEYQSELDLTPQDAIIYASVIENLSKVC